MSRAFVILIFLLLTSCSPHSVRPFDELQVEVPESFPSGFPSVFETSSKVLDDELDIISQPWWLQFEDEQLSEMMDVLFKENYSLKAAWSRLRQAKAAASIATSGRYPSLDANGGVRRIRAKDLQATPTQIGTPGGVLYQTSYFQTNGLSFELDIWRRVASASNAEMKRAEASKLDYENTALLLSGTFAESWFNYLEQKALKELLKDQIKTGEVLLELTQLRYSIGQGTALSVLQQRQQLSATEAELPQVQAALERSANAISILLAKTAKFSAEGELPALPIFPSEMSPLDVLSNRPDLIASQQRLQGAEFDLASAFAERFPRLTLGLNYDFSAISFSELFERQLGSIFGNIALPLIDGGRRRAAVRQADARVEELMAIYKSDLVTSFWEIENALAAEKYQKQLLEKLEKQLSDAQAIYQESRSKYFNGQSDFLEVNLGLQSVQSLERRMISEKRALLLARVNLSLALGGSIKESKTEREN